MGLSEAIKIAKEIGFQRVFKVVSSIADFFLPFIVWLIIFQFVGQAFFMINWAIPGLIFFVFFLILFLPQMHYALFYEFRLMKRIEHAKNIFDNPADPESEKKYIAECERFVFPYVYRSPLLLSGIAVLFQMRTWKTLILQLPGVYISYCIVSLLALYRDFITSIYLSLITAISVPQFILGSFQNWIIILFVVWTISLYNEPVIQALKVFRSPLNIMLSYCLYIFSVHTRILFLAHYLLDAHLIIKEHQLRSEYQPFVDPLTLPRIVQKAVQNVEGKSCNVSRWSREMQGEKEIENLKNTLISDQKMPFLIKALVKNCKAKDALNRVNTMKPIVYIGTEANRCVFLGRVWYDPDAKVRTSLFYFDTIYIKREFNLIMEKETERQRELKRRLPIPLEEIIRKTEGTRIER